MSRLITKFLLVYSVFLISYGIADDKTKNVYLAEKVAAGNDWLIDKGQKTPLLKPLTWVTSRTMSITLFPICAAIDVAVLATKQAQQVPYLVLNKNSSQYKLHLEEYRKNSQALQKTSLGLLTAPMGILSPDIVTHHFVPGNIEAFQLKPYGKLYSSRAHIAHPHSASDVQLIIHEAQRSGKTVSTLGKFMSQGKQAISNRDWNVAIDTSKLNQITIDPQLKIARVGAGASWRDLQNEANKYGLAVRVMQASNIFSIGGSISANCHGWDYKAGCLRNTLMALTIVDAKGIILNITPDDPLFDYIVGGYGGFGVIVEATISLTDNVKMIETGQEIAPRDYVAYFNKNIRDNKDVDMHLYRLSLEPKSLFRTGIAVNYQRINDEPVIANLIDEPERGNRLDRIKMHTIRRLPWLRNFAWNTEKKSALTTKKSSRNELMRPPINPVLNDSKIDTEWLQEYFVKGEDLTDFLNFLGNILQENKVALFNASVRFVKQDSNTKLSYAQKGDRFAVVLFFNQKLTSKEIIKTKKWVREVIDYLIAHEGSYYLPYQHFATPEQFKACYLNWESIVSYKQSVDPEGLFDNGLYADYLTANVNHDSLFRQVFNRVNGQRNEVRDFLNNVFMQVDEKMFFDLTDYVLENQQLDDEQIYAMLYSKMGQLKPNALTNLQKALVALTCLKDDLGNQTAFLVGQRKVNGYVEIGYPGRMIRPLKKRIDMNGPFYVINDKEGLSDYVEAGFPLPYDHFIPLNDYAPIPETAIPTDSVDLVCMYIGLHHVPKKKLDPFIASIKRILKPGGAFILMDHDAHTKELQNFVDVVHSIFNVATGVTPETNRNEIRNFQSLQYWIDRVQSHGMVYDSRPPLIRKGDSTLNSLIRFVKPLTDVTQGEIIQSLLLDPEYQRPQIHTYLTAPEWQNVRAAQRYAEFLEKQPAYRYPYFNEIGSFWKVYGRAFQASQKKNGFSSVALSEYNLMNLFVGTSMTLEYATKGLVAIPFALVDKVTTGNKAPLKKSPSDKERLRSLKNYGNYIENTPFYKYPYFKDIGSYWGTYLKKNKCFKSRIKGLFVGTGMTIEYGLKGLISIPMSCFYGSEGVKEAETTHLLILDHGNHVEAIDPEVVVLATFPEHDLKHIMIPRYMRFTEIMLKIARKSSVVCINIAGNDSIQIDVKTSKPLLQDYSGTKKMYDIPTPTDLKHIYMALEVDVRYLCEVIRALEKDNVEILFIHDY